MDNVCLVLPVLPGKTDRARVFMRELDGPRKGEFDTSERRIGISKELWYLAKLPAGDQLIAYIESADFGSAVGQFSASREAFDIWFKQQVAEITGVDMNHLPPDFAPPELLSHYDVTQMHTS